MCRSGIVVTGTDDVLFRTSCKRPGLEPHCSTQQQATFVVEGGFRHGPHHPCLQCLGRVQPTILQRKAKWVSAFGWVITVVMVILTAIYRRIWWVYAQGCLHQVGSRLALSIASTPPSLISCDKLCTISRTVIIIISDIPFEWRGVSPIGWAENDCFKLNSCNIARRIQQEAHQAKRCATQLEKISAGILYVISGDLTAKPWLIY